MKIYFRDILIVIILVFIGATIYIIVNKNDKKDLSNIKVVDNSTQYYNVVSVVNKYVHYSNEDDKSKIFKILDDDYIYKKGIDASNVFKYVRKYSDGNVSFKGDIMYYEKISDNINKYYVSGQIESVSMNDYEIIDENFYTIVLVDNKNSSFSIIPDDGKTFKEVEKWMLK